jgi:two-component system chemotaxis response regulator CheB
MSKRDIVVIGASAGGVYALKSLAAALPPDFKAAVFVVLHVSPHSPSHLPDILNYAGALPASHPDDGEEIQQGHIYVAPPDHHMLVEHDRILVKRGPKENRFRPSIDALFRSAAYSYGSRVVGVVLTGLLDDGTSGMWSVKRLGGLGVIQEPEDALYASMPDSVRQYVEVDYQVPITELAPLLCRLIEETVPQSPQLEETERALLAAEVNIAAQESAFELDIIGLGDLTPLTCPECSGALVSIREGDLIRYRCHTGHAYTATTLLTDVAESVEDSMWKAIRSLEETVMLLEQSAKQFANGGNALTAEQFYQKARETRERAAKTREFLNWQEKFSTDITQIGMANQ